MGQVREEEEREEEEREEAVEKEEKEEKEEEREEEEEREVVELECKLIYRCLKQYPHLDLYYTSYIDIHTWKDSNKVLICCK